jgi:Protein of unknown function (DUF1579)
MQTGQQGRRALALFTRILTHATRRAIPAIALAVMCFSVVAPAQAAEKPKAETAHAAKAATGKTQAAKATPEKPHARPKIIPLAHPPGEAMVKTVFEHGRASEKDNAAVLLPLIGTWDFYVTLWTHDKYKPIPSTGTVTSEMVMNDHFLSSAFSGSLSVDGQSMPIEGRELIGYDNATKSFSSVRVDSVATGIMTGSGKFDAKKRILYETGRFTNPLTGTEQRFDSELNFVDASHYTRTIFAVGKSGKKSKLMEFDYSRRNSSTPPAKK